MGRWFVRTLRKKKKKRFIDQCVKDCRRLKVFDTHVADNWGSHHWQAWWFTNYQRHLYQTHLVNCIWHFMIHKPKGSFTWADICTRISKFCCEWGRARNILTILTPPAYHLRSLGMLMSHTNLSIKNKNSYLSNISIQILISGINL